MRTIILAGAACALLTAARCGHRDPAADDARAATGRPDLGANADLRGARLFPPDAAWNQPIDTTAVDPRSDTILARIGRDTPLHPEFGTVWQGHPNGLPYVVIGDGVPKQPVRFRYAHASDPGPYPIPPDPPIEAGSDHHLLILDRDAWKLYELFDARRDEHGAWTAGSGAIWDLHSTALRPAGWTSADAAGLPILPGLVRYDEVARGAIPHAVRFTVEHSYRGYVWPARHFAGDSHDPRDPPMGMRVRLRADYDIDGFPPQVQVILRALKRYGMILADDGGNGFITGAPDPRWRDDDLHELSRVTMGDFEVVRMGPVVDRD